MEARTAGFNQRVDFNPVASDPRERSQQREDELLREDRRPGEIEMIAVGIQDESNHKEMWVSVF
jgi:hypothetical protein